jgi:hypothetical protein
VGFRSGPLDPDWLANDPGLKQTPDSVAVKVMATDRWIYVELWQTGEATDGVNTRVWFIRTPRSGVGHPGASAMAWWLTHMVNKLDRQGWTHLRS